MGTRPAIRWGLGAALVVSCAGPAAAQRPTPPPSGGARGLLQRMIDSVTQADAALAPTEASLGRTQRLLEGNAALIERADRRPVLEASCLPGGNELAMLRYCPPDGAAAECVELTWSCAPVRCRDGRCRAAERCTNNADCAATGRCDDRTGACVPVTRGPTCSDDFTLMAANGEGTGCWPYKCAAGACRSECLTTSDCADDFMCCGQKCQRAAPTCQ